MGISPPRGTHPAALIACDGSSVEKADFNARTVTGQKYHYDRCGSSPPMNAIHRLKRTCIARVLIGERETCGIQSRFVGLVRSFFRHGDHLSHVPWTVMARPAHRLALLGRQRQRICHTEYSFFKER
jgi:hypothetical protein